MNEMLLLQDVLDSLSEHVAVLDHDGTILRVNEAWRRFARENGAPPAYEHAGTNYLRVCSGAHGTCSDEAIPASEGIRAVLERRVDHFTLEYPCDSPNEQRWFLMSVTPLQRSGRGAVVSHHDITARKRAELEVRYLAHHDPLTGCLNRRAFYENAHCLRELADRQRQPFALAYCDLNGFKPINDRYGHDAGDALLRHVATNLKDSTRTSDLLARFGGDEFVFLLYGADATNVHVAIDRFARRVETPLEQDGVTLRVRAAFGVSLFPAHGRDLDRLVSIADEAMYVAKRERSVLHIARAPYEPEAASLPPGDILEEPLA